jgi:surface-anchored protein
MTARRLLTVAALLLAGGTAPADFRVVNITEESDIAFFFENGVLSIGLAFDELGEEYAADEVIQYARPGLSRVTVPGSGFDFLGAAGSTAYVLPANRNPNQPYVGFAADEVEAADFAGPLRLQFLSVNGPGDFAVWATDGVTGLPDVFYSTRTGQGPGSVEAVFGGDLHFNYGFSAPGVYGVNVIGTGVLADGTAVSTGPTTLFFGIETVTPVPAPPALGLCLFGGAAAGVARLARRRLGC